MRVVISAVYTAEKHAHPSSFVFVSETGTAQSDIICKQFARKAIPYTIIE